MFIPQNPRTCLVKEWHLGLLGSQQLSVWSLSFCSTPLFSKATEQGPAIELPFSMALLGSYIRLTKERNFPDWSADWPAKPGNSPGKQQFCFVPFSLVPESWILSCDWVSSHLVFNRKDLAVVCGSRSLWL